VCFESLDAFYGDDSLLRSDWLTAWRLSQVATELGFSANGFSIYLNRNKTDEILSQSKTMSLLNIK